MEPDEESDAIVAELAARLDAPVLTDLTIDWGALDATAIHPQPLPDLFAGQSVRIGGRYTTPGRYEIVVEGRVNGRPARLPLTVELPVAGRASTPPRRSRPAPTRARARPWH